MIRFVYFDLGNVIVNFSVDKMLRQVAQLANLDGIAAEAARQAVFESGLARRLECGQISEKAFFEGVMAQIGRKLPVTALNEAFCDMFALNESILPLIEKLAAADMPRGILSNTCTPQWHWVMASYPVIQQLIPSNHLLSFEVGAMKPDRGIYEAALVQVRRVITGIAASEVLFIDDLACNVAAAREFGFDAVCFCGVEALCLEMRRRHLPV